MLREYGGRGSGIQVTDELTIELAEKAAKDRTRTIAWKKFAIKCVADDEADVIPTVKAALK